MVLVVALLVRLIALWAAADARPVLDEQLYLQRAEALLDGEGFVGSYQSWVRHPQVRSMAALPQYPGSYQPPAYTLFAAGALAVSGRSPVAIKLAQVLLGTLTVWLVYAIGRRVLDPPAALVAAWICALYPTLIAFTHYLYNETLFIVLLLLAIWVLLKGDGLLTTRAAAAGGVLFGLATLTRGALLYFVPLVCLWLIWCRRDDWRPASQRAATLLLATLVVIAPWSLRSSLLQDGLVVVDTSGPFNLWRGNTPETFAHRPAPARLSYAAPFASIPLMPVGPQDPRTFVEAVKRESGVDLPTDLQVTRAGRALARHQILAAPGAFMGRAWTKTVDLWNPTSFLLRQYRLGAYGAVSPGVEALISWSAILSYLGVMALAVVGVVTSWRERHTSLILLLVLYTTFASVLAFGLTRFRLPLMPLLVLLAAQGGYALFARAGGARRNAPLLSILLPALLLVGTLSGCSAPDEPAPSLSKPNVLWVVWDTVRADRLSVYGHDRPTTPFLEQWSKGARVYDDCVATAGSTVPSHASMFTGLLPVEHGANYSNQKLSDRWTTLAELFKGGGYDTFLFAANPHIQATTNFTQGFDTAKHPWSDEYREAALSIVRGKISPDDQSSFLVRKLQGDESKIGAWNVSASGELAEQALFDWFDQRDDSQPFFAFLNYMEAHAPYIPPGSYRRRIMESEDDVKRSYAVDNRAVSRWAYCFGLHEYEQDDLELLRAVYDSTLLELDELFERLIGRLEREGLLENTIVVLTADHGEQLGEHRLIDHQYALYDTMLRVPLIVHYPARLAPGRDDSPVSTFDLFPTLLELAGLEPPEGLRSQAVSLLDPAQDRVRLAEYPTPFEEGFRKVLPFHPDFDPTPWSRRLRALYTGEEKFICSSDGRHELYDRGADPTEARNLIEQRGAQGRELLQRLLALGAELTPATDIEEASFTAQELEMLRVLGYVVDDDDEGIRERQFEVVDSADCGF